MDIIIQKIQSKRGNKIMKNIFTLEAKLNRKAKQLSFYMEQLENARKVLLFSKDYDTLGVFEMNIRHRDELVKVVEKLNEEMDELSLQWAQIQAVNLGLIE